MSRARRSEALGTRAPRATAAPPAWRYTALRLAVHRPPAWRTAVLLAVYRPPAWRYTALLSFTGGTPPSIYSPPTSSSPAAAPGSSRAPGPLAPPSMGPPPWTAQSAAACTRQRRCEAHPYPWWRGCLWPKGGFPTRSSGAFIFWKKIMFSKIVEPPRPPIRSAPALAQGGQRPAAGRWRGGRPQ